MGVEELHTIGEVSRKSGVPVKTIRHYSDVGVLPPSAVSEAGYRLYSEADRSRLETLTDEQLAAWVELSELASDDGFIQVLRDQTEPFWEAAEDGYDQAAFQEATGKVMREVRETVLEGRPPTGKREQRVVRALIEANARAMNRAADEVFEGWLLRHFDETSDPRMQRYWHLVSVLKEIEYDPSFARAHRWLVEGLRWRVNRRVNTADDSR